MTDGKAPQKKVRSSRKQKAKNQFSRREIFAKFAALGVVGSFARGFDESSHRPAGLSEEMLISASGLSGDVLTQKRVRAMRSLLEFNLGHLEALREFDPDEEDPVTMFRL